MSEEPTKTYKWAPLLQDTKSGYVFNWDRWFKTCKEALACKAPEGNTIVGYALYTGRARRS